MVMAQKKREREEKWGKRVEVVRTDSGGGGTAIHGREQFPVLFTLDDSHFYVKEGREGEKQRGGARQRVNSRGAPHAFLSTNQMSTTLIPKTYAHIVVSLFVVVVVPSLVNSPARCTPVSVVAQPHLQPSKSRRRTKVSISSEKCAKSFPGATPTLPK